MQQSSTEPRACMHSGSAAQFNKYGAEALPLIHFQTKSFLSRIILPICSTPTAQVAGSSHNRLFSSSQFSVHVLMLCEHTLHVCLFAVIRHVLHHRASGASTSAGSGATSSRAIFKEKFRGDSSSSSAQTSSRDTFKEKFSGSNGT